MALRTIRKDGDEILRKKSKPVKEVTENIRLLVEDMLETMKEANGVGLAAPQVGILKRVIVVDIGEGPIAMINPEIINSCGTQEGYEACLSVPGKSGVVIRPKELSVKFWDLDGQEVNIEAEDFFARAICHEIDHLDGRLFIDIATDIEEE